MIETKYNLNNMLSDIYILTYLFRWDEVPGNDEYRLIEFLMKNFGINWVGNAKIEKFDDSRIIGLSNEKNYIIFILNDEKTIVSMEFDNTINYNLIAKVDNGALNVYFPTFKDLSELDFQILDYLGNNGPSALKDIYTELKTPKSTISYRIKLLQQRDILVKIPTINKDKPIELTDNGKLIFIEQKFRNRNPYDIDELIYLLHYGKIDTTFKFGDILPNIQDKKEHWEDLYRLIQDGDKYVRLRAVESIISAFQHIPDKKQTFEVLYRLAFDKDNYIRRSAAKSLGAIFSDIPEKEKAWENSHRLTQDKDKYVRWYSADNLGINFHNIPDKKRAWQDLQRLIHDEDSHVRWGAAKSLGAIFSQIPDKKQAWQDLHQLILSDGYVRRGVAESFGVAFPQIPDKKQAWQDLRNLALDDDKIVRSYTAYSYGVAFSHIPDKKQAWKDLYQLALDKDRNVRVSANYSLGRASIYRAIEVQSENNFRDELENALKFFETSSKEAILINPASFCFPFYRSFYTIAFKKHEAKAEVQKYLTEAKNAVKGSDRKEKLLEAIENLANALYEAQNTHEMNFNDIKSSLKDYQRYCDHALYLLDITKYMAPEATKLIKKGLPIKNDAIKEATTEIQDKTKAQYKQTENLTSLKFRDLLKGTTLENRFNLLIDNSHKWFGDFGKNDFLHSSNIENNLDRLVPNDIKINENIFDKAEIFLLLYAVYLHDIGQSESESHHEKETYKKIIENPENYGLKNVFEAHAVAEICYGLAKEYEKPIKSIHTDYGIAGLSNKTLNLQFLAALLRLAEEVNTAYIKAQKDSARNLIRFINFDTSRWIIEFQSEPTSWKDWIELKKLRSYTQKRLDEIKDILESKGLLYYQIWLDPKDFSKIQTPRPKDIELKELKQFVGNLLSEEPYYDKKFSNHTIDIYFEEKIKGQSYRNAVFIDKEIREDLIYEYKEIFKNLKSDEEIEHGFIVVEKLTEKICKVANEENIKIITVHELVQKVANFSEYLKNYIKYYEDLPIFKKDCYIPLTAHLETKEDVGIIDDYFDKWLHLEDKLQLTVLGDFGTGKSTVAKRLAYRQAKKYLNNPVQERIPILIELKSYQKSISLESLITDLLINKYSVEINNFNTFRHLNESGRLLLILDGFDEMASHIDFKVTLANFREFDKLISENSKVVLTCRTHYFKNQDEIHKLHEGTEIYKNIDEKGGYTLLFLNPVKEGDFVTYLKKFFPENWEKYYQTIINTYNLRELAEKPSLLELMVQTLPQIKIEENEKLNRASLYNSYTKFWLDRDDWRSYLTSNEREFITEEIAFYLFINDKDKIFYEELPKLIQERFPDKRNFEIDYLDQDVRTCTFLNRDDEGDYSFVHQSFMEFFVAKKFANEIRNKNTSNFKLEKMTVEIANFLVNMIGADNIKGFYEFVKSTKNRSFSEVKYLGGNSVTIMNLLGIDFNKMDLSSTVLVGANFNDANLLETNLSKAIFSDLKDINATKKLYKVFYLIGHLEAIDMPDARIKFQAYKTADNDIIAIDSPIKLKILELLRSGSKTFDQLVELTGTAKSTVAVHLSDLEDLKLIQENKNANDILSEESLTNFDKNSITTFIRADLRGADLSNADLRGVDLSNADLRDANLSDANLIGAKLKSAKLDGTNLESAILN